MDDETEGQILFAATCIWEKHAEPGSGYDRAAHASEVNMIAHYHKGIQRNLLICGEVLKTLNDNLLVFILCEQGFPF